MAIGWKKGAGMRDLVNEFMLGGDLFVLRTNSRLFEGDMQWLRMK